MVEVSSIFLNASEEDIFMHFTVQKRWHFTVGKKCINHKRKNKKNLNKL